MKGTTRYNFIDTAKFIGLILVLFCHIPMPERLFHSIIYSFHMPLFFLASGIFLKKDIKRVIFRGVKTLIFPYVLINILLILCKSIIFCFWGFSFYDDIISPLLGIIFATSDPEFTYRIPGGPSWFLISLFFSRIIACFTINQTQIKQFIIISILLLFYFILYHNFVYVLYCIDSAILGSIFVIIGFYLRRRVLNFPNFATKKYFYSILLLLLLSPILACNGISNMFKGEYGNNIILFFVNGLVGSLLLLLLCSKINFQSNFLKIIIGGSIFFIVFHTFIMEYVMLIYKKIMFLLTKVPILEVNIIEKCIITIITTLIIYLILKVFKSKIPILYR